MTDRFFIPTDAHDLVDAHGSPLFVYSRQRLERQADTMLGLPAPFGKTIRYAMKANPHPDILALFCAKGIHIDASSAYEAEIALAAGFKGEEILVTSQQMPHNLVWLIEQGVQCNATSLRQLEAFGQAMPGGQVSVRINPGIGSGHSAKTNVGGPSSSFGIWHEYLPQVHELLQKYRLTVQRVHTHIGSGTDPTIWRQVAQISLSLMEQFPQATIINLGGGFKVARTEDEKDTDVPAIGEVLARELASFAERHDRQLHLELEPGTFLVAAAGTLLASVDDITDTGEDGYTFMKLDTGMTDILRPSLYGAQHPIAVLNNASQKQDYVVVGHCCESGDLLTPAPGESEMLSNRSLNQAKPGDIVAMGGAGAYCASMAAHGYNGYPSAGEILVD